MSASLDLKGVAEMRVAIEGLSEQMTRQEFAPLSMSHAHGLADEVRGAYPKVTGNLADHVKVVTDRNGSLNARVRTTAKHAHLYEYGTVRRFTAGTGANRGTMPARPVFVPAAIRWRARMMTATKAALQRMRIPGFTGSAEVREV